MAIFNSYVKLPEGKSPGVWIILGHPTSSSSNTAWPGKDTGAVIAALTQLAQDVVSRHPAVRTANHGGSHQNCEILGVPSGKHTKSYWKWPLIVDFPIKNCDFP